MAFSTRISRALAGQQDWVPGNEQGGSNDEHNGPDEGDLTLSQMQSPSRASSCKISSSRLVSTPFWSRLYVHFSLSDLSPGRTRNVFSNQVPLKTLCSDPTRNRPPQWPLVKPRVKENLWRTGSRLIHLGPGSLGAELWCGDHWRPPWPTWWCGRKLLGSLGERLQQVCLRSSSHIKADAGPLGFLPCVLQGTPNPRFLLIYPSFIKILFCKSFLMS